LNVKLAILPEATQVLWVSMTAVYWNGH